nr:LuxR C-terminal-related transcriptional regulator [Salinivirgaceae bacterium]
YKINKNLNNESAWGKLNLDLDIIQDQFLTNFAKDYPTITSKDLKICAYIRMNLPNEEIASLLHISRRSLEMSRYRIRKKIKLDRKTQLNDFILRY